MYLSKQIFFVSLIVVAISEASGQTTSDKPNAASNSAILLDPVTVTDRLDRARDEIVPGLGATEYSIDKAQIASQSLGSNASFNQVLLRVPSMAEDSYGQLHLRGEHANLQYRINDVLLPEGISGFGQELDTPFIQSVSLLTGSLPAQYGFRTAGVVDIHTQTGPSGSDTGEVTVLGGSFDTQRANFAGASSFEKLNVFGSFSLQENNLGIENPTPSRSPLHDHSHQSKLFTDLSYLVDSTSRITLLLSGSFARFQIPNNPGQSPSYVLDNITHFPSIDLNENQNENNAYSIIAYQKSLGDLSFQLSAFSRYSSSEFLPDWSGDLIFNGVASHINRAIVSNGVETEAKWVATSTHTIRGGFIITNTHASNDTWNAVFKSDALGNQASSAPIVIQDNTDKVARLFGVYIQDEWQPFQSLTINYGFRADASEAYLDEGQISPRVNAVYKLSDATTIHLGYARYFTPPPVELVQNTDLSKFMGTTNQAEVNISSPVRSERSDYFDIGINQKFGRTLSVSIESFYKNASDQLDEGQFGSALIFSPFNYKVGHIYGGEIATNFSLGGFAAYANLALGRANGRDIISGQFEFGQEELNYIASHEVDLDHEQFVTGSAGFSYRFINTLMYIDTLYGSGLRRGFANTAHLPAYHPVNIGVERTWMMIGSGKLRLRLDIVNLFDEIYQLRDGSGIGVGAPQFGQRRGFYGSVGYEF